jgi:Regulated-SNARE-like domain
MSWRCDICALLNCAHTHKLSADQICICSYSPKGDTNDEFAVKSVITAPNVFVEAGKRYTNEGDVCCVHFVADDSNRVYSVVTDKAYPPRVAFAMLDEVQSKFVTKVRHTTLPHNELGNCFQLEV